MDVDYFPVLQAEMARLGYESHYEEKVLGTKEGLMTSYKKDLFEMTSKHRIVINDLMYERASLMKQPCSCDKLKSLERDSVAAAFYMKHLPTGKEIIVCEHRI